MERSLATNGGDGPYSYAKNSHRQKDGAESGKEMLSAAICEYLDTQLFKSGRFSIADLGCSTGPNTFITMNNIVQIITNKYKLEGHSSPLEFQVFFNDLASNDFNALFTTLPGNRDYFASAVPGSFYGRLFPKSTINVFYSSFALHWLSKLPEELGDLNSPMCNKGRIYYGNAPNEVGEAYAAQYAKDIQTFLAARAVELVGGGLMALITTGRPAGTTPSDFSSGPVYLPLEHCLLDMADEGLVSREKIDSFNVPTYSPSIDEVKMQVERNGQFVIARLETLPMPPSVPLLTREELRSITGNLFKYHFGMSITEQLFERYAKKIKGLPPIGSADGLNCGLFIILKRNHT